MNNDLIDDPVFDDPVRSPLNRFLANASHNENGGITVAVGFFNGGEFKTVRQDTTLLSDPDALEASLQDIVNHLADLTGRTDTREYISASLHDILNERDQLTQAGNSTDGLRP